MFNSSQNKRLYDILDELRKRYDRISENIQCVSEDWVNESRRREKLRLKRNLDEEESDRDSIEKEIRQVECQIARNSINSLFEELLRLDYVAHTQLFYEIIANHKIGAFVLYGKGKCGVKFLRKRLIRYLCEFSNAAYSCIPVNVASAQGRSFWSNLGTSGNDGFDIRDILNCLCKHLGCDSKPETVAERLARKRETKNVILLLEGIHYSGDVSCIFNEFWSALLPMFPMSINYKNALVLLLITEDESCLTECDTVFADTYDQSWTPATPVRLPAASFFKESDVEIWMNNLFSIKPHYEKSCGSDFLNDLMKESNGGFTDMVIRYICQRLTNHPMDDGTLEGELREWLKY